MCFNFRSWKFFHCISFRENIGEETNIADLPLHTYLTIYVLSKFKNGGQQGDQDGNLILIVLSCKFFGCIPNPWKHRSRYHNCSSTSCTGWAIQLWRKLKNGQDGSQNNFVYFFLSWKCFQYIPYLWKHRSRHQNCRSTSCTG